MGGLWNLIYLGSVSRQSGMCQLWIIGHNNGAFSEEDEEATVYVEYVKLYNVLFANV